MRPLSGILSEVEHYIVQIKIRHGRRVKGYSVTLDPNSKSIIRHHLDQIRAMIDRLKWASTEEGGH